MPARAAHNRRADRRLRIVQPVFEVRSRLTNTTMRGRSPASTFSVIAGPEPPPDVVPAVYEAEPVARCHLSQGGDVRLSSPHVRRRLHGDHAVHVC
jgi:hypothetical protein